MKIDVLEVQDYSNCVKVKVKCSEDKLVLEEWFGFEHSKFPDGEWLDSVKTWFEDKKLPKKDCSKLVGKSFEV